MTLAIMSMGFDLQDALDAVQYGYIYTQEAVEWYLCFVKHFLLVFLGLIHFFKTCCIHFGLHYGLLQNIVFSNYLFMLVLCKYCSVA